MRLTWLIFVSSMPVVQPRRSCSTATALDSGAFPARSPSPFTVT